LDDDGNLVTLGITCCLRRLCCRRFPFFVHPVELIVLLRVGCFCLAALYQVRWDDCGAKKSRVDGIDAWALHWRVTLVRGDAFFVIGRSSAGAPIENSNLHGLCLLM
jgi:hypothetical protein